MAPILAAIRPERERPAEPGTGSTTPEVESRHPIIKRVTHPLAGPLEFECRVLHIPDTGQRMIVYCAAPGSATQAAFRRLAQLDGPAIAVPATTGRAATARAAPAGRPG